MGKGGGGGEMELNKNENKSKISFLSIPFSYKLPKEVLLDTANLFCRSFSALLQSIWGGKGGEKAAAAKYHQHKMKNLGLNF